MDKVLLITATSDIDIYIKENIGTAGETGFTFIFTSPVGYNFISISESNAQNFTQISTGSQSGSNGNIKIHLLFYSRIQRHLVIPQSILLQIHSKDNPSPTIK